MALPVNHSAPEKTKDEDVPFLNKEDSDIGVLCGGIVAKTRNFKIGKDGISFETDNAKYKINNNGTIDFHAKDSKASFTAHIEQLAQDFYNNMPDFSSIKKNQAIAETLKH